MKTMKTMYNRSKTRPMTMPKSSASHLTSGKRKLTSLSMKKALRNRGMYHRLSINYNHNLPLGRHIMADAQARTVEVEGVEHTFAPPTQLVGEDFSAEYPPITDPSVRWLRCKYTGQIYAATPYLLTRTDKLEPYFGDPYKQDLSRPVPSHATPSAQPQAQQLVQEPTQQAQPQGDTSQIIRL